MASAIARLTREGLLHHSMILYGLTIVTSAFLLFLVQPIVAKQILPWFGGTAAVWTVCVVFFQAALLAGYSYAHGVSRLSSRVQGRLHIALLALSSASLPIVASPAWKPIGDADPTWRIAGLLAATIGLPYVLLASTGPLLQRWLADDATISGASPTDAARVYRLFALSNAGSLVGLLCYPFLIEPFAGLHAQSWGWSIAYGWFAVTCAVCAFRTSRRPMSAMASIATEHVPVEGAAHAPSVRRHLFWLAYAALGTMLLLALTNHITQNIASIPFLWILPLALYLGSFILVFEGRGGRGWYVPRWWLAPVMIAVTAATWALSAQRGVLSLYVSLPIFCAGLFTACVFCHGELARTKPGPAWLTQFYLSLAAGGTLGGLFVALVAPAIFTNYWETPIALCAVPAFALSSSFRSARRDWIVGLPIAAVATVAVLFAGGGAPFDAARQTLAIGASTFATSALLAVAIVLLAVAAWRRWPVAIVATALACTGFYAVRYYRFLSEDTLVASRNFYGALRVKESGTGTNERRDLMHGVILHGDQYRNGENRYKATTYYGAGSGVAIALQRLRPADEPIDVGMIGLGAGTLTAWGRAGDRYRIYDINPAIVDIAKREFTYLADSRAATAIVLGDARLSMEREIAEGRALRFDVIAVDAFSSDAIPVHLITREALDVFLQHLKDDGIVAFHVSNRYLRLAPVVAQIALDAHAHVIDVIDDPDDDDETSSEWVLVTRNRAFAEDEDIRRISAVIKPIPGLPMWTDQFNNLFKILK